MAGGAIAGAIIVLGLSKLVGWGGFSSSGKDCPPPVVVKEYLEWPNQRQFEFFRSLLVPYAPPPASEVEAEGWAGHLEECDVCMEEGVHYVLYLSCNHAVICTSCELQVWFGVVCWK